MSSRKPRRFRDSRARGRDAALTGLSARESHGGVVGWFWELSVPFRGGHLRNLHGNVSDLPLVYVIGTHLLTCYSATGVAPMKSKLTLRFDEDLKERAKRLAKRRGTSVSKIVEHYFRLLLQEDSAIKGGSEEGSSKIPGDGSPTGGSLPAGDSTGDDPSGRPSSEPPLSPRIRRLKEKLGQPAPEVEMDEDTRRWVEAAAEKHA